MIAPRYISGQVVAETRNGGYVPYRGVDLQTRIGGPTMKYKTNGDGDWAIPVVSAIPGGNINVQVFHEDAGSWFDVPIPWSSTWRSLRGESFRITIKNDPPNVVMAVQELEQGNWLNVIASSVFPTATAAKLFLPETIQRPAQGVVDMAVIERTVIEAFREVIGDPSVNPGLDWRIDRQSELSYIERIQLIENLESKFKLAIPDEHWQSMSTLAELADYLNKRKILEAVDPEKYKIQPSRGLADIDTRLPVEQRPSFK
jgi:acyl carrier protein